MQTKEDLKARWDLIAFLMKYNSCSEANQLWESDWSYCPVCLEKITLINPIENDDQWIIIHKDQNLLRN